MTPSRVLAWLPYPEGTTPSQRFRVEQWAPDLRARGIEIEVEPFAGEALMGVLHRPGHLGAKAGGMTAACLRRARRISAAVSYDCVVIHRAACLAGPAMLERRLARAVPVVYDFDDAIFRLHTTSANRWTAWLKFPGKTEAIARAAAHVTVGNTFLAEHARRWNPHVTVIPSSVDTEVFRPRRTGAGPTVVVGWTGSSTSMTYLEASRDLLREIAALPGLELRVHSDREPELGGVPFVYRPWRAETEAEEIAAFDIGLMPMPDDVWARGKGAMKALLYMAVGIPVVLSPIGTNLEVVSDGIEGLFASTADEWVAAVRALAADPERRAAMGRAGRARMERDFSRKRSSALFGDVIARVVEEGRRR